MKKLFLMSLFGLFIFAATSGQSVINFTLVTPAFANQEEDIKAAELAQADANTAQQVADEAQAQADIADAKALAAEDEAKKSGSEEAQKAAEAAREEAKKADELAKEDAKKAADTAKKAKDEMDLAIAFHCPKGITTCYKADGSEYTDLNNLPPSAAGPRNIRSF